MAADNSVDQSNASAEGDIVAGNKGDNILGDKVQNKQVYFAKDKTAVEKIVDKLKREIEGNETTQRLIDELVYFHDRISTDGINGLENKLQHAGLGQMQLRAFEQKEKFAKFLEKWSLYHSAQELISVTLVRVRNRYEQGVYCQIGTIEAGEIGCLTMDTVVQPLVDELTNDIFIVDDDLIFGMLYWLAEQCFVRWH